MPCSKNEGITLKLNCPKLLHCNPHIWMYLVGLYFLDKHSCTGKTIKFKT